MLNSEALNNSAINAAQHEEPELVTEYRPAPLGSWAVNTLPLNGSRVVQVAQAPVEPSVDAVVELLGAAEAFVVTKQATKTASQVSAGCLVDVRVRDAFDVIGSASVSADVSALGTWLREAVSSAEVSEAIEAQVNLNLVRSRAQVGDSVDVNYTVEDVLRANASVVTSTFLDYSVLLQESIKADLRARPALVLSVVAQVAASTQAHATSDLELFDRAIVGADATTFRHIETDVQMAADAAARARSAVGLEAALEATAALEVAATVSAIAWLRSRAGDDQRARRQRVAALDLLASVAAWARVGDVEDVWEALHAADASRAGWALSWLDTVAAELVPSGTLIVFADAQEEVAAQSATSQRLTRFARAQDRVEGLMIFKLGQELLQGWAVNLEGALPVSEYRNWDFNSFAKIGDRYFAAGDGGLYALGAEHDDGEPISARVLTMMTDFDTPAQKRVVSAYMGYTASGELVFKVRSVDDGVLTEHWYAAQDTQAVSPRENMVRLGRGMKSRYWQFEIENVDGADFEVDQLELHPVRLRRRV